jgi:hypothetical protein
MSRDVRLIEEILKSAAHAMIFTILQSGKHKAKKKILPFPAKKSSSEKSQRLSIHGYRTPSK